MKDLVIINSKKEAVTTSRILAGKFKKRHDNVLAKIEQLKTEDIKTFTALKIKGSKYKDDSGKTNKEYQFNRDAYAFFAMGFTGKESNRFKIDFIKSFNAMEEWIKERLHTSMEYKSMCAMLKEVRALEGKITQGFHYANEANLVNWALTGEYKKIERENLTHKQLETLSNLERYHAVLLGSKYDRTTRKQLFKNRYDELTIKMDSAA